MRIITFMVFALISYTSFSQVMSYNDLGILLSRDNNNGTARFNALSGAFGAVGGDISSTNINPAGAAIAKRNSASVTLMGINNKYSTDYYGNSFNFESSDTDISQAGALFSFDSAYNSKWNRFAIYFDYHLKNNFNQNYTAEGYSYPVYDTHFADTENTAGLFDQNLYQYIQKELRGSSSVFNIGFSSAYEKKLFLGAALKIHDIELREVAIFEEDNDDIDGNILYIEEYNDNYIQATGISLNFGFIYKFNKNVRFGLAYETPAWYQEVIEDYYNELFMDAIDDLEVNDYLDIEDSLDQPFVFSYRSPSTLTASGAYIFGKKGLISVDYTYKDYTNTRFKNADFNEENNNFINNYRNTYALKVGTEWRFNNLSLRGGASYEKDPNLIIGGGTNEDNIKSYSLGLGYNFGNSQIDISYANSQNTNFNGIATNNDLAINNNISKISGTLTINL